MLSPSYPQRAPRGTAGRLRAWQQEALDQFFEQNKRDFLVAATPGAGKTTYALTVARELRQRDEIDRVVVVCPTEHLKTQWADAAARVSIRLDPEFSNGSPYLARHYHGAVVTYAQVAVKSSVHRALVGEARTLVILDEVHHGGDALSWGDAIRDAYEGATRRLLLSGTPFRSDEAPIPFVEYAPDEQGLRTSVTDYSYGYGRALADGVVRPVLFHVYTGHMKWRTRMGDEMEANLGQDNTKDITSQAWRTALDPEGDWMPAVLKSADQRLTEIRHHVPDAGGLVIATDQSNARAYAALLRELTGQVPTVVLSDEEGASSRIEQFSQNTSRWMVAVRMVSEGVDVPRLAVGVYATSSSTPLFFAQAIGRFVRARRKGEAASVFLPQVPVLMQHAHEMEKQRDHVLDRGEKDEDGLDDSLLESAEREEKASDELMRDEEFSFQSLGSTAHFDSVVFEGQQFGQLAEPGTEEELEFIGIPGLLEPEHVHDLLMQRQARQSKHRQARESREERSGIEPDIPAPLHRTLKEQRQLLNSLVGVYARQTGDAHGQVHAWLRRSCGGPPVAQATVAQLQARVELLRKRVRS
ncbi:DEAD/DEAH box helicase [Microbacterium sp. G2-8]|uniref:DEAD/DEAH box helicase n=1 Tax=Microbacterium sp. G2-8 TaxID=2842454 RepID=UPI0027E39352|nr:DEAD/DEAH box helicase [Microbacterium sp. G2-8]